MQKEVIFRVDGDSKIGLGHIYRCLALAQMLKGQFKCIFITHMLSQSLSDQIGNVCEHHNAKVGEDFLLFDLLLKPNTIIVLDGYHFNEEYQCKIKSYGVNLVVIDDFVNANYIADAIINHGLANPDAYINLVNPSAKVYTGFKHLLVREVFLKYAIHKKVVTKISTLFICMGGADPINLTPKILKAAISVDSISKIIVVTGSAYSKLPDLMSMIELDKNKKEILHYHDRSSTEIARYLASSQIAICPSSSIALEACCIKAGLLTGYAIDNQKAIHDQLTEKQCSLSIGDFNNISLNEIKNAIISLCNLEIVNKLISNQAKFFDGLSGERNLALFQELSNETN